MHKHFKRLPLSAKLMMLTLIPLALLVYFSLEIYKEKNRKIDILDMYLKRIEQSTSIGSLVDNLQTERRFSFGNAINQGWKTEMILQRSNSDASLTETLKLNELKNVKSYTFLDSLPAMRASIDAGKLKPFDVLDYYSNVIFRLNTMNMVTAANISYLEPVRGDLAAQKLSSEMITYLGIVRSYIYLGLYNGEADERVMREARSTYKIYKSYEAEFNLKASASAKDAFKYIANNTDVKRVVETIEQVLQTNQFNNALSPDVWWRISASAVDEIKILQRSLSDKAREGISATVNSEVYARDLTLLILVIIIALVIGIMLYTINVITKSLNQLNTAANTISTGATGINVQTESNDVIGSLAQSILRIDKNNQALADAAVAIGSGNFFVSVTPRSDGDILGNAVVRMKKDLQQFNEENEQKLWIHEGVEIINESLRGEKKIYTLAADILHALTPYINGKVGLLYLLSGTHLQYAAGYAVADTEMIKAEVGIGETLIGQVAQQGEIMHLENVPNDFIKIKTGSGEAIAQNILIIPFLHNNHVEGVMEIGALEPFNPLVLSFIEQVSPAIAIAFQSAKSRLKLQELFEQSQAQSEELQSQHNELEHINAEMEAQTEKLQASEEELKVQQEELIQANKELEERSRLLEERNQVIVEKNIDIQKKAEELEVSSKYKSEFLANMSHELRTPLNSVLLLSRLLSENNEKNLSADQVEYANVIQTSGKGLLSLIDEILDLSKIEAGKMELEYQPVMLQEIVYDMKSIFTPMADEKKIDFNIRIEENLPSQIETDKMRLEQVLKNLLSNAIKFTTTGSVELLITSLKDNPAFIAFSVKDTGIGIPKDKLAIIFEAFQQADGSTRRKFGGTGLGLSISRELTKLLGGEIKVTSEPGKGSEFTINIPVKKTTATANHHLTALSPTAASASQVIMDEQTLQPVYRTTLIPSGIPDDRDNIQPGDKVILVVEDDTAFAKALLEYTHQKGFKGLVAVRGDEGIALAQQYMPMGILLDIQLPVKDGWEVMEELKSNPATRHIPVHIMSSLNAKKESLVKGAVDFINKPVAFEQMQEVFQKIEHVLSKDSKKVLIVEENPKHAKALAYFLETFNVNTEISNSINTGVGALTNDEVDCVILDMGIPDLNAYETLEMVKKRPGLENLPIIIFTGRSLSKTEELRIKQYADSIVIKTAHSYQRIIDEVSLFLHLMKENDTDNKRPGRYKRMGALNEVLANKKVLVVDDDVRNIFSLTKALELHNLEVITAVDGKEALQQLNDNPAIDIVLMDIMMPEMDGYEAMQKIRSMPAYKNLPVIAVTAKAMTGDREKCIKAGASDYISKPVDIDQLLSLLRVWLYDKSL